VCFPPQRLAQGAHDLQALLAKHGFMPGVAGHAAHGNLHFTLIAKLDEEEGRTRYASFMKDLGHPSQQVNRITLGRTVVI
jgi:D-lactate dehydrogenase